MGAVDPTAVPTVSAEVPGRVLQVLVDVGDPVKAGQVLAILDDQDVSNAERAARSEVKRLEALVANQQRLTERYRELVKKNFISPLKMDETESQLTAVREQLTGAEVPFLPDVQELLGRAEREFRRGNYSGSSEDLQIATILLGRTSTEPPPKAGAGP